MIYNAVLVSTVQQSETVIHVHISTLFKFFFLNLFIYFLLHWVFVAVLGLLIVVASLVAEHGL